MLSTASITQAPLAHAVFPVNMEGLYVMALKLALSARRAVWNDGWESSVRGLAGMSAQGRIHFLSPKTVSVFLGSLMTQSPLGVGQENLFFLWPGLWHPHRGFLLGVWWVLVDPRAWDESVGFLQAVTCFYLLLDPELQEENSQEGWEG